MPQLHDTPANQVGDAIAEIREIAEGLDTAAPADVLARQKRLTRLATFLETFTKDEIPPPPLPYQLSRTRLDFRAGEESGTALLPASDPVAHGVDTASGNGHG